MKSVKCPSCGLVAFASAVTCKRCGGSFETSALESTRVDAALQKEIEARKTLIYIIGFGATAVLSMTAAMIVESTTIMIFSFGGILVVGFVWTWALGNKAETQMLGGRKRAYTITPGQRASVVTAGVAGAGVILNSDYGYILAPLLLVIVVGGMYLYEREMRAKRAESGE